MSRSMFGSCYTKRLKKVFYRFQALKNNFKFEELKKITQL